MFRPLYDSEKSAVKRLRNKGKISPKIDVEKLHIYPNRDKDTMYVIVQQGPLLGVGKAILNPKDKLEGLQFNYEFGLKIALGRALQTL